MLLSPLENQTVNELLGLFETDNRKRTQGTGINEFVKDGDIKDNCQPFLVFLKEIIVIGQFLHDLQKLQGYFLYVNNTSLIIRAKAQ